MVYGEQQHRESKTIRERTISLNLSDADVLRISEKAASVGLTVSQLLENFIGDLVCGTYSNGSDERLFANQWLDRCGFTMYAEKSLLRYALLHEELDGLLRAWDERADLLKDIAEAEENPADMDREEKTALQEELAFWDENLQELFTAYRQYHPQCADIDKEMEAVLQWRDKYHELLGANTYPA